MKVFYWFSFIFLLPLYVKANETLKVGMIEGGRAPYFFAEESEKTGLYKDILSIIERKTKIEFTYHYYPQARLRRMMISGSLDVEMGTDPSWRQEKNEVDVTSYSVPFMLSRESWVVSASNKQKFQHWSNTLQDAVPCVVLGFNVEENMKKADVDVRVNSDLHLLEMLKRKRCDVALIPNAILDYYHSFNDKNYAMFPGKAEHQLSLRIGNSRRYLLPKINKAINDMKSSGKLQHLFKKYGIRPH